MATKSFLNEELFEKAQTQLETPSFVPDGNEDKGYSFPNSGFSAWLGLRLEEALRTHPHWMDIAPVALGSWARGELCPRSDVDLLFCGEEKHVVPLVNHFYEQGIKIRYRMPENPEDWSAGVGPTDWVAILHGKPFTPLAHEKLFLQQKLLRKRGKQVARQILQAMEKERKERNKRYDSISNFLEPNLKYGGGGLRDLQQALYVAELFSERFSGQFGGDERHAFQVLDYYKQFLLTIRQKIHLMGGGDVLVAQFQEEIGAWFGYKSSMDFMREVQKGLSRVSFYSDWIFEVAKSPAAKIENIDRRPLRSVHDCFAALRENPSVHMQYRVRRQQDLVFRMTKPSPRVLGRWLSRYVSPEVEDSFILSLFRSRLIDKCIPNLRALVGLVQHNQYHRYAADTHIMQCLRMLLRFYHSPKKWPLLSPLIKKLTVFDWQVLAWTCLYHDIGKGRSGDHSEVGAKIVAEDFKKFGFSKKLCEETIWMVENHLTLSEAAFRKNSRSRETWKSLHEKGVSGNRLHRLAIFTAIDIQATNPEAWNDWKQKLLVDLVNALGTSEVSSFISLLDSAEKSKIKLSEDLIEGLDAFLIESLPRKVLLDDYKLLKTKKGTLPPRIVNSGSEKWLRLHSREDRPGIFVDFVQRIFSTGASIRQASVRTFSQYGVYDWFLIKTTKSNETLLKLLSYPCVEAAMPKISFDEISIVSEDDKEIVLSFRGRDRSGALVSAAKALFDLGLEIRWAAVHTWGRMLDDVFGVARPAKPEETLDALKEKLLSSQP